MPQPQSGQMSGHGHGHDHGHDHDHDHDHVYVNVYVFGTTEHTSSRRVFLVPGQATYTSLADAQAAADLEH